MYKIVLEIVEKIRREDHDKASILMTILNTEGLDHRDKISGVIGKHPKKPVPKSNFYLPLGYRFY